jgi:hypothetical protein
MVCRLLLRFRATGLAALFAVLPCVPACPAGAGPTTGPAAPTDESVIFARKIEDGRQLVVTRRPVPLDAMPELRQRIGPGPGLPRPPTRLSQVSVNLVTAQGVAAPVHTRLLREYEDVGAVGFDVLDLRLDPGGVLLVLANEPEGALTLTVVLPGGSPAPRALLFPLYVGELRPEASGAGPIDPKSLRARIVGQLHDGLGIEVDDLATKRSAVFRVRSLPRADEPVWVRSVPPS